MMTQKAKRRFIKHLKTWVVEYFLRNHADMMHQTKYENWLFFGSGGEAESL